jgi:hypothetical protein
LESSGASVVTIPPLWKCWVSLLVAGLSCDLCDLFHGKGASLSSGLWERACKHRIQTTPKTLEERNPKSFHFERSRFRSVTCQ